MIGENFFHFRILLFYDYLKDFLKHSNIFVNIFIQILILI